MTAIGLIGAGAILLTLTALGFTPRWLGPQASALIASWCFVSGIVLMELLAAMKERKR